MAKLNDRALQRIRAISLIGDEIAEMFKLLARNATECDSEESAAALQYKTDKTAKVGEYIPSIHLVVTRVTEDNIDTFDVEKTIARIETEQQD